MIRMFARRLANRTINPGEDRVLVGLSLPSGSRVNNISIDVRLHQVLPIAIREVTMYAVEGWIVPVLDPDAATLLDTIWDQLVPKDTDVETIDLDTTSADSTPFYEPGEPDFSSLMDVGFRPERIYHRNRLLSIGNGSIFTFQDNQTPFLPQWIPGDSFRIRIRKNYAVRQPSVLMFAVANPSLDDTSAVSLAAASEAEWGQTKYIGHVLERALLHLFGVTEAGAETPWEEATALLKKHLEPDVFEETAGTFDAAVWDCSMKAIIDHSVEGRLGQTSISTGR